ncbi:F-box family protein-related [Raphanus sativus]|nr:F-box family protein-related [Raphanus sativus]
MSVHQNSASCSWSLMYRSNVDPELVGHYNCDTWGFKRPLGYFFNSFLTDMNLQQDHRYRQVSIQAYSDAGLILIERKSTFTEKRVLYVANPVSQECVEIFFIDPLPREFGRVECSWEWGLVTRTEHGHLLGYKVILVDYSWGNDKINRLIYSSETDFSKLPTILFPNLLGI